MNSLVVNTINKYEMLQSGDRVIVALSGGADSVTLLDVLNSLKEQYNLKIFAAHINHNLRGNESKRDEDFCKILCKKYNTELFIKSENVRLLARQKKISEELCGRQIRYSFFEELSNRLGAKIATAHTASDNAETLLFNIVRGTSVTGTGAIPPKRGNIIRPLIELTRNQIEQYCNDRNLEYVTDSTNLSDDYTRNNIRHNIIPVLLAINPKFELSALHLSENAREITNYLNSQSSSALDKCRTQFGYDCKKLLLNDTAVIKNAVVLLCRRYAEITPENKQIEMIVDIIKNGGTVCLSKDFTAVSKQGILRIVRTQSVGEFEEIILKDGISFDFAGKTYSVNNNSNNENKNQINIDLLNSNAVFRTRRSGDKFTYPKRKITKPLRKVMNEMKIPSEQRDKILVLASGCEILWCESIGASVQGQACKSDRSLEISVEYKNEEDNA